jgi:hypothetical protein
MIEEQKVPRMHFEGKESDISPEIEQSQTSFTCEESLSPAGFKNIEKVQTGDKLTYCTICNKQVEKYGRRKEDFKKPGWVFCPKHGWIQEGVYDIEMDSEKPIRLSIEEVREDHDGHEKLVAQKESDIPLAADTSKQSITPEEIQQETIFFNKREHRADLSTKAARNKLTVIGIIVSIIFFIVIVSFLLGYFVQKDSSKDMLEIKSMQALAHNKKLAIAQDKFKVSDYPQGLDSTEKSMVKSNQIREPLTAIYTVQVGAFTNIAYARSLQNRLSNKGYHCFISTPNSKGEGKLNKVLIGKFGNRKRAESLSKKISETENIRVFVTLWENNI